MTTRALFIMHLALQVGVIYGNPEITSGGNALKFYASVRLEVRRKATIKGATGDDDVGIRVKAKVQSDQQRFTGLHWHHVCPVLAGKRRWCAVTYLVLLLQTCV